MDALTVLAAAGFLLALYAVVRVHRLTSGDSRMATKAEFDTLVADINAATNAIAARIAKLEESITNAGLPADVETTALGELRAVVTGLQALGADPSDPVPTPEPEPGPSDPV